MKDNKIKPSKGKTKVLIFFLKEKYQPQLAENNKTTLYERWNDVVATLSDVKYRWLNHFSVNILCFYRKRKLYFPGFSKKKTSFSSNKQETFLYVMEMIEIKSNMIALKCLSSSKTLSFFCFSYNTFGDL